MRERIKDGGGLVFIPLSGASLRQSEQSKLLDCALWLAILMAQQVAFFYIAYYYRVVCQKKTHCLKYSRLLPAEHSAYTVQQRSISRAG